MATVDFDSETGDTWARMVYDMRRKNPRALRYRPAVDRQEQLLANEVNRHMTRAFIGYTREEEQVSSRLACDSCGSDVGPLEVYGAVYTEAGRFDRYRCAGHSCRGGQNGSA